MTAEEPYQDMPLMQVVVSVVRDGMRPPIPDTHAATPYADLMRACWSEEPPQRPSFDDICGRLEVMLQELEEQEYACVCRVSSFSHATPPIHFFSVPHLIANLRARAAMLQRWPTFQWNPVSRRPDDL